MCSATIDSVYKIWPVHMHRLNMCTLFLVTLLVLKMVCARVLAARNTGRRQLCGLCACITQGPFASCALSYTLPVLTLECT